MNDEVNKDEDLKEMADELVNYFSLLASKQKLTILLFSLDEYYNKGEVQRKEVKKRWDKVFESNSFHTHFSQLNNFEETEIIRQINDGKQCETYEVVDEHIYEVFDGLLSDYYNNGMSFRGGIEKIVEFLFPNKETSGRKVKDKF